MHIFGVLLEHFQFRNMQCFLMDDHILAIHKTISGVKVNIFP